MKLNKISTKLQTLKEFKGVVTVFSREKRKKFETKLLMSKLALTLFSYGSVNVRSSGTKLSHFSSFFLCVMSPPRPTQKSPFDIYTIGKAMKKHLYFAKIDLLYKYALLLL